MQQLVKEEPASNDLKQMVKDCEGFAKRPIDEEKLKQMEEKVQEIQL